MQCNPLVRRDLPNLAEHLYLGSNLHIGFTSQLVTVWWGWEGFVWALMLNHELLCSDLNWGYPAAPPLTWYWAALLSPFLAWRLLKSSCEDSWVVPWGHCPVLRAQTIPAASPGRGSVWREGEFTGTPFSVHMCDLAFKSGSSSRTELGCLLESTAGLRPCRWGELQS